METVFLKLFNMSITASWLVLAVVILRLLLKKAPKAVTVFLWALVGIRLVCPFSFESVLSLIPSAETLPNDILTTKTPAVDSGIPFLNQAVNPIISGSLAPNVGYSVNPMQVVAFIGAVIWLVGIAVMLIYTLISYLKIHRKVREAVPYNENIWVCDRISAPFILGVFRPRIYLPSSIDKQDEEYVIAHERAHLKRRDHLIKPLGFLLLTVYWFNPVMWIAYILLCRDIELACDEKVIKTMGIEIKKPYSEALINCSLPRRTVAACPLAFGEVGVKSRIKSVLNYKKPAFWVVIVAIIASIAVAVGFLTNPKSNAESVRTYKFTESEDIIKPSITLFDNGEFKFTFSALSSYIGFGKYESDGAHLTLKTDDVEYIYVFDIVGDTLVFDAEASSDKLWGSGLYNGAVFNQTEGSDDSSNNDNNSETDSSSSQTGNYNPYFNATVLEVYKNSVLVEPFEDSDKYISAYPKITVSTNVVSTHPVPELKVGMQIRIVYNGDILSVYPPIIETVFAIYELREVDGKLEPVIATPPQSEAATSLIDSDIKEIYVLSRPSKGQIDKFTVSKTYTGNKNEQLKTFLTTEYCEEKEADNWVKFNPATPNQTKLALVLSDGGTMLINIHFTEGSPYYIAIGETEESFDPEKDYSDIEYTRYIAKAVFGEFLKSII